MEIVHDPFPMSELQMQLMWVVPRELPPVPLPDGRFIFGERKMGIAQFLARHLHSDV